MFTVSVDGGEAVECDAYAAVKDQEALLYESGDLEAGTHTALITVLGKRNEASTGSGSVYGVQFVYAKVYGGEAPEEPEFPGYTDIDDSVETTTGEAFKIQYEPSEGGMQNPDIRISSLTEQIITAIKKRMLITIR